MGKARHPAHTCTPAQRATFDAICIGRDTGHHPKVIKKLLDRGLICRGVDRVLGLDRFGKIKVPSYYVPLPHHMAWAEWGSDECKKDQQK